MTFIFSYIVFKVETNWLHCAMSLVDNKDRKFEVTFLRKSVTITLKFEPFRGKSIKFCFSNSGMHSRACKNIWIFQCPTSLSYLQTWVRCRNQYFIISLGTAYAFFKIKKAIVENLQMQDGSPPPSQMSFKCRDWWTYTHTMGQKDLLLIQ